MTKKMTYAQALTNVLENEAIVALLTEETVAKLEALKDSVEKKNGAERKPTEKQKENEGLKSDILGFMEIGKGYTVTEILKGVTSLDGMSQQKVSALITLLRKEGLVERQEEKRVAKFYKVSEVNEVGVVEE